jgi:hypothetical protein
MIEILGAIIIGAILGASLMGLAIVRDDAPVEGIMPGTFTTVACEEDQPCWDSCTMGNRIPCP